MNTYTTFMLEKKEVWITSSYEKQEEEVPVDVHDSTIIWDQSKLERLNEIGMRLHN